MGTKSSTTKHVIRQRSPLVLAAVSGATGLVLLASMAFNWADSPQPLFVAWVLFLLAGVWAVFVRPAVLLDEQGVTIRNVFKDIHIPWALVTDVQSRWNLRVFVGDRAYTAWAISSQIERPGGASGGMFSMLSGRLEKFASASAGAQPPTTSPKVTASMVARTIEQAKEEYAEAVASGELPASPDDRVRTAWVPVAVAIVLLPAIAVVALSLS